MKRNFYLISVVISIFSILNVNASESPAHDDYSIIYKLALSKIDFQEGRYFQFSRSYIELVEDDLGFDANVIVRNFAAFSKIFEDIDPSKEQNRIIILKKRGVIELLRSGEVPELSLPRTYLRNIPDTECFFDVFDGAHRWGDATKIGLIVIDSKISRSLEGKCIRTAIKRFYGLLIVDLDYDPNIIDSSLGEFFEYLILRDISKCLSRASSDLKDCMKRDLGLPITERLPHE